MTGNFEGKYFYCTPATDQSGFSTKWQYLSYLSLVLVVSALTGIVVVVRYGWLLSNTTCRKPENTVPFEKPLTKKNGLSPLGMTRKSHAVLLL